MALDAMNSSSLWMTLMTRGYDIRVIDVVNGSKAMDDMNDFES